MDRGQDQPVFVFDRRSGQVAGRVGRIEREIGEKLAARPVIRRDLLDVLQIAAPGHGILVAVFQQRIIEGSNALDLRGDIRFTGGHEIIEQAGQPRPGPICVASAAHVQNVGQSRGDKEQPERQADK